MKKFYFPYFSIFIALATFIFSCYVAYQISGSLWGKARIIYLADYGGINLGALHSLALWKLFSCQLIHVHQSHMLLNVLTMLMLASLIERKVGAVQTFAIWFVAGVAGTIFSSVFTPAPWDLGTGASQAVLGFAGYAVVLSYSSFEPSRWLKLAVFIAIIPALYLDVNSVGYAKPGHVLSFVIGLIMALLYLNKRKPA
ncbi:rhomboid family intramembrane serine protease [Aliiglaciecola sp. LCG003]|uniref:rhomboid family intramembrane serine protease n=1 Tax=Aliiglaciecola sp. LCG003 TaxID=3053655 RepID=UPI0025725F55|nr:rhomboid family intramembrane serine protease [Aliiglaciecola sp. LCG003]WJG10882.1 rhomboid family intramembrane serine protease [Aliiglaciecola sp. LCG003]